MLHVADHTKSEPISDDDSVSRHIYSPRMHHANVFRWECVFEFPSAADRTESVVWRAKILTPELVHDLGCKKEKKDTAKGNIYIGFITSLVSAIRRMTTTNGHGFEVYHDPTEGIWHAVIKIIIASDYVNLTKNDKADIRELMKNIFEPSFLRF